MRETDETRMGFCTRRNQLKTMKPGWDSAPDETNLKRQARGLVAARVLNLTVTMEKLPNIHKTKYAFVMYAF